MSKFVITYENDIEKRELTFKGKTYDMSMIPNATGSESNKPGFDIQYMKKHPTECNEEVEEILDMLSFTEDSEEIFECLATLDSYENE